MLVGRDGRRVRIVPDQNRAYGSGMSTFGDLTLRDRPGSVGPINNIALHISLVTPPDGRGDAHGHSGYTNDYLAPQSVLERAEGRGDGERRGSGQLLIPPSLCVCG